MSVQEYPRLGERVYRERLAGGLEVVVVQRPYHAKRCALFAVRYGGLDLRFRQDGAWRDTPAGVAHYLEHKMFDTEDGSAMQDMGRSGGDVNAFTAGDMTAYHFSCTENFDENLEKLLRFVSVPYFTEESVERERGIIAQEIRQTMDDPEWRVYEELLKCLYGDGPVSLPVAGTVESIAGITPKLLYDCHRAFYTPANMVLVCVGDMEPERVTAIAAAVLPETGPDAPERDYGEKKSLTPVRRESKLTMDISMPQFLAGFQCPPPARGEEKLRESMIADLACDALFGESSPLYNRLYAEGLINSSLGGGWSDEPQPGAAWLYVGGDAREPYRVLDEILTQARRLGEEGIPDDFFDQLRRAAYGGMLRGLNSLEDVAVDMAEGAFQGYDYYRFPEVFETVTKSDVERFLRENVTRERAAMSLVLPRSGELEETKEVPTI